MRWLVIGLLVSLGALLFAAAAVAHHICHQRARLRGKPIEEAGSALDPAEEADREQER